MSLFTNPIFAAGRKLLSRSELRHFLQNQRVSNILPPSPIYQLTSVHSFSKTPTQPSTSAHAESKSQSTSEATKITRKLTWSYKPPIILNLQSAKHSKTPKKKREKATKASPRAKSKKQSKPVKKLNMNAI